MTHEEYASLTPKQKDAYRKKMRDYMRAYQRRKRAAQENEFTRAKRAYEKKRDVLLSGANLGKRVPNNVLASQKTRPLNGEWDAVMRHLRVERVKANDRITQLDAAITALEPLKPIHV